jgi:LysR family nitrogen assimilation transcriptional regulator
MDLRQLRYVVQVAETTSISRAAHALNMAQPSLSHQIRELESELGVRLFHRAATGVTATEAGKMLAERARGILRLVDMLGHEVRNAGASPVGEVMVGLPTTMALHLTVPLVQAVRGEFPGISLRVSEGMSGHIQEWVLSGRLDIAILYTADPVEGLDLDEVTHEELCLISQARPGQKPAVPMRDIGDFPLVLPGPDHGLRRTIERACRAAGVRLAVPVEVDSLPQMKRLVAESDLHTILPAAACREEIAAGRLVARRFLRPALVRPIVVATPSQRPMSLASSRIRERLRGLVAAAVGQAGS